MLDPVLKNKTVVRKRGTEDEDWSTYQLKRRSDGVYMLWRSPSQHMPMVQLFWTRNERIAYFIYECLNF